MRSFLGLPVLALAAAIAPFLPAAAQELATPEARPAATTAPAELPLLIQTIRLSDNRAHIATAYARACAINRNSLELHEAYMRRMLRLGQPEIAQYPARSLTTLEPANPLAWATLAYVTCTKGYLPEGLNLAVRSLQVGMEDASTLFNAGQLAAWHDLSPDKPKLPERTRQWLVRIRKDLEQLAPYVKGYAAAKGQYDRLKEQLKDIQGRQAAIEADLAAGRASLGTMEAKLRNINDDLRYRHRDIAILRGQLWQMDYDTTPTSVYRLLDRQAIRERIREHERQIDALELDYRKQVREGDALAAELKAKDSQLGLLKKQASSLLAKSAVDFVWEPPAVDGVVTYEADAPPATGPARKGGAVVADNSPSRQLELAKLYISHGMVDKAVGVLGQIIQSAPESKAAEEARKLLAGMK